VNGVKTSINGLTIKVNGERILRRTCMGVQVYVLISSAAIGAGVLIKALPEHQPIIALAVGSIALAANTLLMSGLLAILATTAFRRALRPAEQSRWTLQMSATCLISLGALLAGRKRSNLRVEWQAHLGGKSGHDPITWPKVRQALGFVAAAIQFRLADAAVLAWRPADAVLGSRTLSNLFVWGPVIVALFAIVRHDGRFGLVADIQDPAALGAFLYGVIRTGRWWRGVKPPEPKVRRARE
jgi:hypothetical protein